jgi:hypothetical protein
MLRPYNEDPRVALRRGVVQNLRSLHAPTFWRIGRFISNIETAPREARTQ